MPITKLLLTGTRARKWIACAIAFAPLTALADPPTRLLMPREVAFSHRRGQPAEALPLAPPQRTSELRALPPIEIAPAHENAANQATWTLADVEQIALQSHPALAQGNAEIEALRGKWWQAGRKINPTVGYIANEIGEDGGAGQHGISLSQTFLTGHKRGWRDAVVGQEVVVAQQRLAATRLRVITDVRLRFQQALLAQYRLELLEQLSGVARQTETTFDRLLGAMEARRIDLLQAKVQADKIELKRQQASARLSAAWRSLLTTLGDRSIQPRPLTGSLRELAPNYDWDTVRGELLAGSPLLAEAAMEIERARLEICRQHAEAIPNVTAQLQVTGDTNTGDTLTSVGLSLPLPVWHRNEGNIAQAQGEYAAAQQAYRRTEYAVEQRLAEVYRQYMEARVEVEQYESAILPAASETLELTRAAAAAQEASYLEVFTVQRTNFEAQLDYLDALDRLGAAALRVEGMLLEGALTDMGQ